MPTFQTLFCGLVISFGGGVFVLFLFLGYGNMLNSFKMVSELEESLRPVNSAKNDKYTVCNADTRKHMLTKNSLPIIMDTNGDIDQNEIPGCFVINKNESGINRIMNERNFINTKCVLLEKRFLNNTGPEQITALASIPGSGNTWVRHLIEDLTGIYTGSIYRSRTIDHVFKGEHTIHNVIAVKTHNLGKLDFGRAIIIVRDPFESTLAEYNRRKANKTAVIPKSQFNGDDFKESLNNSIRKNTNVGWINSFKGDLFILYYDKLKTDLANSLTKLAAFLHSELSLERLWCTLNNKDGSFKRVTKPEYMSRKKHVDEDMERSILKWKEAIDEALVRRGLPSASN